MSLIVIIFISDTSPRRSPAPVVVTSQEEWPALPSPARPLSARAAASNTPPVYASPFPEAAPKGRGKTSSKRGSDGRGGRGAGGRGAGGSDARGGRGGGRGGSVSSSYSDPAVLTGVDIEVEGLGPDAPAQSVLIGEPSRGIFMSCCRLRLEIYNRFTCICIISVCLCLCLRFSLSVCA